MKQIKRNGGLHVMVFRRAIETDSDVNSASEVSSGSSEDELEDLIDNILDNLVVYQSSAQRMTIKNKNRKERPKQERQDRPNELETASTSNETSFPFTFQGYGYQGTHERPQSSTRNHGRISWPHGAGSLGPEAFSYSSYAEAETSHILQPSNYIKPSLKRQWSPSVDQSKNGCDCREGLNEERIDSDDATGNNSEDEYYRVPDNVPSNTSKTEDNGLEQLLKEKKGWKIVHVRGDGACLFRSVSHQVFGDEEKHEIVRKQVVDYMVKNREHFSQYVTEDFDRYLQRKRHPNCYGNHLEIQAISELYNRPVEIYHNSASPINVFHAEYSHEIPLRLGYYGRTHYNSIIDPCKPSFGQGLGMPNYQPGLPEQDLVKQALNESEASELEEAMLRDKLAESETKELEACITDHVLRESYYEHWKSCFDIPVNEKISKATWSTSSPPRAPMQVSSSPTQSNTAAATATSGACSSGKRLASPVFSASTSKRSQTHSAGSPPSSSSSTTTAAAGAASSSSTSGVEPTTTAAGAAVGAGASAASAQADFAVLQYLPEGMLDMSEDELLAMVLEQSRNDYLASLRASRSREEYPQPSTAQSFFRQQLEPSEEVLLPSFSNASPLPLFSLSSGGGGRDSQKTVQPASEEEKSSTFTSQPPAQPENFSGEPSS
uniref:ubiquitinyl hydrolase 1 n=2 Tax=Schistocephalus solidus TaxID=70667 RepID=A0A0X3NY51_SCHSO